jgi:hypothetical protein
MSRLIDADKFLEYLIFSKHIDSLKCAEVKEAVKMCEVKQPTVCDIDAIRQEIEQSKVNPKEITMYEFHNDSPARFYNKGLIKAIRIIDKHINHIM